MRARHGRLLAGCATLLAAAALAALPCRAGHLEDPVDLMWQAPEVGKSLNNFELPDPAGGKHRLSDYRGRVFLLSFWSCYTDSCFTSVSVIGEYLEEFHDRGFAVLTVCSEVPPTLAEDAYEGLLRRCSTGQTVLVDGDRAVTDRFRLHTASMPVSYLVGRDYIVREIVSGTKRLHAPSFRSKILRLLDEGAVDGR